MRRSVPILVLLLAVGAALPSSGSPRAKYQPAPLSEAERYAVQMAAQYLESGPSSWWQEVSETSALYALGAEEFARTVEFRAGPPENTIWTLRKGIPDRANNRAIFDIEHETGFSETLELTLVAQGEDFRLRAVRSLIDPVERQESVSDEERDTATTRIGWPFPPPRGSRLAATANPAALGLAAFLGLVAWVLRSRRPRPLVLGLVFTLLLSCGGGDEDKSSSEEAAVVEARTATHQSLLHLRRELSKAYGEIETAWVDTPDQERGVVGRLWMASHRIRQNRLDEAKQLLAEVRAINAEMVQPELPLELLLRAKLGLVGRDEESAFLYYEAASEDGLDHDGLRLERASAFNSFGYTHEGASVLQDAAIHGSRDADIYYTLARQMLLDSEPQAAEATLLTAWNLRPIERRRLFSDPLLALLSTRNELFLNYQLGGIEEPRIATPRHRNPIPLPAESEVSVWGDVLLVRLPKDARLEAPGGASLAPQEATVENATSAAAHPETEAYERLQALTRRRREVALSEPGIQRQVLLAIDGLNRRRDWQAILDLTSEVASSLDAVSPALVRSHVRALTQLDRTTEALSLLVDFAKSDRTQRGKDPVTLYYIGQLLAENENFDLALRVFERVNELAPGLAEPRVAQIQLRQRLAEDGVSLVERGFEFLYPPETNRTWVRQLAWVFEQERERLRQWIPDSEGLPLRIELYRFDEFQNAYRTEVPVAGLFDQRIRLPMADSRTVTPEMTRVLSHELAHAMIWRAAGRLAPRWYQEGLASRIEMDDFVNTLPELVETDRMMSLPMIEAILGGFSEPQFVSLAYQQAQLIMRFVEDRYGVQGIQDLLTGFAGGGSTEEVLADVLELDLDAFDAELRAWGSVGERFWTEATRRYDDEPALAYIEVADSRTERRVTPAVSSRRSVFTQPQESSDAKRMREWYPFLLAEVEPVVDRTRRLRTLLAEGDDESLYSAQTTCEELTALLLSFQSGRGIQAPVVSVEQALRRSSSQLLKAASKCTRGDLGEALALFNDREHAEETLTRELARFQLKNPLARQ